MNDTKQKTFVIGITVGMSVALLLLVAFISGILVGRSNNSFIPMMDRFGSRDVFSRNIESHGVLGTIQTIGANTFVVKERTGTLKTVLVDDQTVVRRGHISIKFTDLKLNEPVIVLGNPEKTEEIIKARIVRTMGESSQDASGSGMMRGNRYAIEGN